MIAYIMFALLAILVVATIILNKHNKKEISNMANEVEDKDKDVIKPDNKPDEGKDTHVDSKPDNKGKDDTNEDPIEKFAHEIAKKNNGDKNVSKDDNDASKSTSSLSDDDLARIVEAVSTKMAESESEKKKSSSAAAEAIMASISNARPKKVDPWEAAAKAINDRIGR